MIPGTILFTRGRRLALPCEPSGTLSVVVPLAADNCQGGESC